MIHCRACSPSRDRQYRDERKRRIKMADAELPILMQWSVSVAKSGGVDSTASWGTGNFTQPQRRGVSAPLNELAVFVVVRSYRNSGSSVIRRRMLGLLHRAVDLLPHRCVSRPSFCSQILVILTVLQEVFHCQG